MRLHYNDPYAYERKNWSHQIELFTTGHWADHERYVSGYRIIFIDDRNGKLIEAKYSSPAFNSCGASRSDCKMSYDEMYELVKRKIGDPGTTFRVSDPAPLLKLNEDNRQEWVLIHLLGTSGLS